MNNKEKIFILLKSFLYRIYSSIITFFISFVVTGKTSFSLWIGATDFFVKIFTYYFYEFIWSKINKSKYDNKLNRSSGSR